MFKVAVATLIAVYISSKIRFICNDKDEIFTYSISKDGSRMLLSNGDILVLKVFTAENPKVSDAFEYIKIRKDENISTYYKL